MFTNAVFQGGGIKAIALVGALKRVEETGVRFSAVGGTSAGAIVAALYAAGYSAGDMERLLIATDFRDLLDQSTFPAIALIRKKGLHSGDKLYRWIFSLLREKGIRSFRDTKIVLRIVASDLTNQEQLVFDANSYPDLDIAEAVRMSIGIPLFFQPFEFGNRLIVDGGLLSNYPLGLFDRADETVGFKLVSKTTVVPEAPRSWLSYLYATLNTMLDAHDKEYERGLNHRNAILIDNGGIPTTKFDLTTVERQLLFQNGYYAASQYLNENVDLASSAATQLIKVDAPFSNSLIVRVPRDMKPTELVRVSISGLFRICVDGKYLLVRGQRINQYQPVGGVFKRLPKAIYFLKELGVLDDDCLPIDADSRDDLRVRVPLSTLPQFLQWFRTESGREVTPEREFREELVATGLVSAEVFRYIYYERLRTHVTGIGESHHFNCPEVLIAEIYELNTTHEQTEAFRAMQEVRDDEHYIWAQESLIKSRGYDRDKKVDVARISETVEWTL